MTAPGVSVIKVVSSRRPNPLPRVGDSLSAAGTTDKGSHGERQLVAVDVHTSAK